MSDLNRLWSDSTASSSVQQNSLRKALATLKSILNSTNFALIMINPAYEIQAFNRVALEHSWDLFGKVLQTNTPLFDYFPEDTQTCLSTVFLREIPEHILHLGRHSIQSREGQTRWFQLDLMPVLTDEQELLGFCISAADQTTQVEMEAALHREEEKYRNLVENINEILYTMDFAGQFTYISPAVENLLVYTPEEMTGRSFIDFVHPDDQNEFHQTMESAAAGQITSFEFRMISKDGETRRVQNSCRVIYENEERHAVSGMMIDVTEQFRIRESLRQSEETYRNIFNNAQVGLFRANIQDGRILECNEQLASMFGYAHRVDVVRKVSFFDPFIHPTAGDRLRSHLLQQGEIRGFVAELQRPDGTTFWIRLSARLYLQSNWLEGVAEDITEGQLAEERLRESEQNYRRLIEQQGEGLAIIDLNGKFLYVNPAGEELYNSLPGSLIGHSLTEFIHPEQWQALVDLTQNHPHGEKITLELFIQPFHQQNKVLLTTIAFQYDITGACISAIHTFRDISQRKEHEKLLHYQSTHDAMTGLDNRAQFDDTIQRLSSVLEQPVGVIVLDVNGLKLVNDTIGHAQGDQLLIETARVLKKSFRESDLVARIGGDEFVVIMPGAGEAAVSKALKRIQANITTSNRLLTDFQISLAVGSCVAASGNEIALAFTTADQRMYRDKRRFNQTRKIG